MPWFRVDDNLGFHHKVIAAGNPAMGLWVRAGSVSASQLTDGFVADHMVASLGTTAQAKRLVEVGLWRRVEGGYTFHEWEERQPRRVDVEAERAAAKERMRAARERKRKAAQEASPQVSEPRSEDVRANTSRSSGEVRDVFGDPDPSLPDPSLPDPPKKSRELTLTDAQRDDVDRICEHLAGAIEANGSKRPTITTRWRSAARLMLDKDGRTEDEVHGAIEWSQRDEFWRANILSLPTLREKYDTLRLQAQRKSGGTSRTEEWRSMQERQMQRAIEREREMGIQR